MKKIVYLFSVLTLFSGVLLYSCDTTPKDDTTDNDVKDTVVVEQNNTEVVTVRVATTEEWTAFKKDAVGAGDLQLLAAIGAWVGPTNVGTVLSLAFFYVIAARLIKKKDVVPYGPGLIAGMWIMLLFQSHVPAWARLTF